MSELQFRLAREKDRKMILDFVHTHWDVQNPFLDEPVFFSYYFEGEEDCLRFALAEEDGRLVALAGYVPSSCCKKPDIWVSFWLADKNCRGAGLDLMAQMQTLTGCRYMSCNNIRPKTRVFYEFIGFSTGRVEHFYRLAKREQYQLARVQKTERLPVSGFMSLHVLSDVMALRNCGFSMPQANPYKDLWHVERRYFRYPNQKYLVYAAKAPKGDASPLALLVVRVIQVEDCCVLRIVDYIGDTQHLPQLGTAIEGLLQEYQAEYIDFYCVGIEPQRLKEAGFTQREEHDTENIIPNYLDPPLFENTEYYYFTSEQEQFRLCKADGDQDRPRHAVACEDGE